MRISTKDWKNYIDKLSKLNKEAGDKMSEYVAKKGFDDPQVIDYAYGLVTKYGEGSASLSAMMYDAIAEMEGKILPSAEVAETPEYGEVAKAINGVRKHSQNPNSYGNVVNRLVKRTGADTMLKNADRDGAEFAWVPSGDTCAFCIALASRGWQHISKKSLKNGHAEHIHANCDCNYTVRFDGRSTVEGYDPDEYLEIYENAEGSTPDEKINSIRAKYRAENREKINAQKRAAYAEKNNINKLFAAEAKIQSWVENVSADSRDKYGEIIKRGTVPMQHGFSCFGDDSEDKALTIGASNIKPKEGFFDVAMHGDVQGVGFGGKKINMGPRLLADIITHNPDYNGENIRLLSCKTGSREGLEDWQYCFAEELSNILGKTVEAPDDLLYIDIEGSWFVGLEEKDILIPFTPNQRGRYK